MSAQGADGADASAQTTTQEVFGTPVGAILATMEDLPAEVRESEAKAAQDEAGAAAAATEEGEPGASTTDDAAAVAAAAAAASKPAGTKTGDEDHPVPEEWPQSAKTRVAEEAQKRRDRTAERDKVTGERDEARARLAELEKQSPVQIAPSARDPLADVTNEQELAKAYTEYEQLAEWAIRYPDGLEGVQIGVDPKTKEPIVKDYSKEEMTEIRLRADKILRKEIPAKAAYLNVHQQLEPVAREAYPALFEAGTPESNEYKLILKQLPEITRFPDYKLWIGDAIYRRNERNAAAEAARKAAEGKAKPSPTVAALLQKPATQRAPSPTSARVPAPEGTKGGSGRGGASDDVVSAQEQKAIESGGDDADIDALVGTLLGQGKNTRDAALV